MKRDHDVVRLGSLIRKARIEQEMPLRKLVEASGVSMGGIVGLEKGEWQRPSPKHLRALAAVLGLNTRDLFELAGYMPDDDLPSLSGLLQVKYRQLPEEAVAEIDSFVEYQLRKHGINKEKRKPKRKAS